MHFDNFVNRILKENLLSIPTGKKEEKQQVTPIKKIADITSAPQQQGTMQSSQPQIGEQPQSQPKQEGGESTQAVDELVKQMSDAQKKEEDSAKKMHDDFAKLIATLTATQKVQQQTPTTAAQTSQTKTPEDVMSAIKSGAI